MHKFLFKGSRKYLHGTDMVIYLEKFAFKPLKLFDLKIHKKILNQPKILIKKKLSGKAENYLAICKIFGKENKVILFQNSKDKITQNYPFDEEKISKKFILKQKEAECKIITPYHSVEILVALTKFWHKKNFKKEWLFTRLKLRKWFSKNKKKNIKIQNIVNFDNVTTISNIFENDKLIGQIFFQSI